MNNKAVEFQNICQFYITTITSFCPALLFSPFPNGMVVLPHKQKAGRMSYG
jgi:hypothetical protein